MVSDRILQLLKSVEKMIVQESVSFEKAAGIMAETVKGGGLLHLAAGDMSSTGVFEPFMKPGCLCAFSPVTEPTLSTLHSASRAYYLRNSEKIGEFLVSYYRNIRKGDCLILADVCGSVASDEMIQFARVHGQTVVYISGTRKPAGADVQIALPAEEDSLTYAVSSVALSACVNALNLAVIDALRGQGLVPDIWAGFKENGCAHNERMIDKYRYLIKQL